MDAEYWLWVRQAAVKTRVEAPNDPKLSDGGAWRGACPPVERTADAPKVVTRRSQKARAVTRGAVRCSAWLGVALRSEWTPSRCIWARRRGPGAGGSSERASGSTAPERTGRREAVCVATPEGAKRGEVSPRKRGSGPLLERSCTDAPNDPKLSDSGVRRGTCMVGGKVAVEAGAVTHGAVRCSAWLGVRSNCIEAQILEQILLDAGE